MHPKNQIKTESEISFYESLLKRLPGDVDTLKLLAESYTSVGRHQDGLAVDFKLRSLCPDDGYVHYNLACSLSLCDRIDEALAALKDAINVGYKDLEWMNSDPDIKKLRGDPRYQAEILPLIVRRQV